MANLHESIRNLLEQLRVQNESDLERQPQRIDPPEPIVKFISTMKTGFLRPLSPMLAARYSFASSWINARLSQNWLSLSDIAAPIKIAELARAIEFQRENCYGNEPPGGVSDGDCTIYAYNPYELETTWLVWSPDSVEPKVWEYYAAESNVFDNLEEYLRVSFGQTISQDRLNS